MWLKTPLPTSGVFSILRAMTITVFGASGKVGRLVVAEALRRGMTVRAFVHSSNPFGERPKLTVIKGDVYGGDDIAKALAGVDAAVSCLGSWGTPKRNVLSTAMQAVIPAMQAQKISRIVTLTGSGALAPDKRAGLTHAIFMHLLAPFPAGKVFADGEEHMRLLAASNLDWTTIRSPVMNRQSGAGYTLTGTSLNHLRAVTRQSVANCLLDQLGDTAWLRRAPIITRLRKADTL